jgi:integrase
MDLPVSCCPPLPPSDVVASGSQLPAPDPPPPASGSTTPQLSELIDAGNRSIVPSVSAAAYRKHADHFRKWLVDNKVDKTAVNADILVAYVEALSLKYKVSTIWTRMSAIKSIFLAEENIDLDAMLTKANKILTQKGKSESKKQASVFTPEQISQYLHHVSSQTQLHFKLAVMFQWFGGLRMTEALNVHFEHVERKDEFLCVKIPRSKTDQAQAGHTFMMMRNDADRVCCPVCTYDEYLARVPVKSGRLFLQCRDGRFTQQVLGKTW